MGSLGLGAEDGRFDDLGGCLGFGAEDRGFSGFGRLSGMVGLMMIGSSDLGVLFWVRNWEDVFGGTKSRGCR